MKSSILFTFIVCSQILQILGLHIPSSQQKTIGSTNIHKSKTRQDIDKSKIIYIEPEKGEHTHTLIFFHGLGGIGQVLVPFFEKDGPLYSPHLKVVLPTSSEMPQTFNTGKPMTGWFDMKTMLKGNDTKTELMITNGKQKELIDMIHQNNSQSDILWASNLQIQLANEEMKLLGNDPSKIIIGGFSQGGIVSLATLQRFKGKKPLGGIIALSGINMYDKAFEPFPEEDKQRIQETPLFMYMGTNDQIFNVKVAETTLKPLQNMYKESKHPNFVFKVEDGLDHGMSKPEIKLMKQWLQERLTQSKL